MKVISRFRDKYTKVIYQPGDDFASNDVSRVEDLINRKLIEGVKKAPSSPLAPNYEGMTKKELMQLLIQKDVEFNDRMTKPELIKLLGGD